LSSLDIMEYTSQHLEAGYQKIYKWCTFQARGFARDVLEVSATVRTAIARLKSRPDLLSLVTLPTSVRVLDADFVVQQRGIDRTWNDEINIYPQPLPRCSHSRGTERATSADRTARSRPHSLHRRHAGMDPSSNGWRTGILGEFVWDQG